MVNKKGFTLIELIIVIAIIAILATTVILVLNPVNIMAEARDSQRVADLGQLKTALELYLATVNPASLGDSAKCYVHVATGVAPNCGGRHSGATTGSADRSVNGDGWLPVKLEAASAGSPLSALPVDPTNDATHFYSYATDGSSTFELNAEMESERYANGGDDDKENTDGGSLADVYELGNDPGLDL